MFPINDFIGPSKCRLGVGVGGGWGEQIRGCRLCASLPQSQIVFPRVSWGRFWKTKASQAHLPKNLKNNAKDRGVTQANQQCWPNSPHSMGQVRTIILAADRPGLGLSPATHKLVPQQVSSSLHASVSSSFIKWREQQTCFRELNVLTIVLWTVPSTQ